MERRWRESGQRWREVAQWREKRREEVEKIEGQWREEERGGEKVEG